MKEILKETLGYLDDDITFFVVGIVLVLVVGLVLILKKVVKTKKG
jgi:hypothetical protein